MQTIKCPRLIRLAALAATGLLASTAQAALLDLDSNWPDLQVYDLDLSYSAAGGSLSISESLFSGDFDYSPDGLAFHGVTSASYTLNATLDGSGNLLAGTLSISGAIAGLGINAPTTLLAGELSGFGFQDGGAIDAFDFTVGNLSGELAADFGASLYVLMTSGYSSSDFAGSFATDFSGNVLYADNLAAVPVPPAAWLLGSGLIGLAGIARRRNH